MKRPIVLIQEPNINGIDAKCVGTGIVDGRREDTGVMINVEFVFSIVHIAKLISNSRQGIGEAEAVAGIALREAAARAIATTAQGTG